MSSELPASGHTIAQAVAFSTIAQILARVVHLGLNVVASLALVRYFGPAAYGDYVFVMSFCALFGLLSDFGLTKVAVRDMSRTPERSAAILGTSIAGRLGLAMLSVVLVQLVMLVLGVRVELRVAASVASLQYVSDALLSIVCVFQLRLAMQYEALVTVVSQALDTALILALVAHAAPLVLIVAAPVASGFAGVALAAGLARFRFHASVALDPALLMDLLGESLPVGATLLLAVAYLKLDSVLLGILATPTDVGLYGAAYKPVEYLLLAAAVVVQPLFTLLARWYATDPVRFEAVYRRGAEALLAYALPVAVTLAFVSEPLVRFAYSADYAPAALPMFILSVAVVFMVLSSWQGFTLLAGGKQRATLAYDAAGLLVNTGLNLVLIRWFGYLGAAYASLTTAVFVVTCSRIATGRLVGVHLNREMVFRLVLANVGLAAALWLSQTLGMPWLLAAILAGLTYPVWLFVCRVTSLDEMRVLLRARPLQAAEVSV